MLGIEISDPRSEDRASVVAARRRRRRRSTIAEARPSTLGSRTRDLRVQAWRSSDLGSNVPEDARTPDL
eukprot:8988741-Pyramimonas_sp.AAC.1